MIFDENGGKFHDLVFIVVVVETPSVLIFVSIRLFAPKLGDYLPYFYKGDPELWTQLGLDLRGPFLCELGTHDLG